MVILLFNFFRPIHMNRDSEITHEGIVQSTDSKSVMVMLSPNVSCAGCSAARACNPTGSDNKLVRVEGSYDVKSGEKVIVAMNQSLGYSALFLGYLIPLILVVLTLIVLVSFSINELYAGLFSIGVLIPYYIILFVFRKMIGKKFSFTIKTINTDEFYSSSDNYKS
jgi:sigma-E factor negative regulatory protein RseC